MKAETKYKGSIKLSAIGDALGWMTEFEKNPNSVKNRFGTEKIEQFRDWKKTVGGRFVGYIDNIQAGSYSDDTQLLLAVARSIKSNGEVDNNYFSKVELHNWLDYARGGGRTVKTAADKIARKSVTWSNNFYSYKVDGKTIDYRDSGANGAAMRILPIALANLGDIEKIKEEIFCNSLISHGHPRAILGAMLYGYAVNQIIIYRPEDFSWETYLTQIGSDFSDKFQLSFARRPEVREWIRQWNQNATNSFEKLYSDTLTEAQNQLRLVYQSIKHELTTSDTLKRLGCYDSATKGSGIATVVAGIYLASKHHNAPMNAITEAVNSLGSDTDSIAAFTGGLIGALHGQSIIPDKWKKIQDASYLDDIASRLLDISEGRLSDNESPTLSGLKSLNGTVADDYAVNDDVVFMPLGKGKVTAVDRQPTLTKGKYNLIIYVTFNIGQSAVFSKLFNDANFTPVTDSNLARFESLLSIAKEKLKPATYEKFKMHITAEKKMSAKQLDLYYTILVNES